jgi:hypothetical protein
LWKNPSQTGNYQRGAGYVSVEHVTHAAFLENVDSLNDATKKSQILYRQKFGSNNVIA